MKNLFTKSAGEDSSGKLLPQNFFAGSEQIVDYCACDEFLNRGQRICFWIVRGTDYDGVELFSNAYLKTRNSVNTLRLRKIQDEEEFYKWFFVLALNLLRDHFRRLRKERLLFDDLSEGALTEADPSVDLEGECLVSEFMEATKTLPEERRRAIILRREGRTYREVATILNEEGFECTHVTVRTWIRDSVRAFFDDESQ